MKTPPFIIPGLAALAALCMASGRAQDPLPLPLPISGRPVQALNAVDVYVKKFMEDRKIDAGVVGISRGGKVVYLRAFGWLKIPYFNIGTPLPETAMMRVASISKVVTAAAVHELELDGAFGPSGFNRRAFNLIGNGGILDVTPPRGLGDPDFATITVSQLLGHAGGFRRSREPFYQLRKVFDDLSLTYAPPSRYDLMRWRLGQPLDDTPGGGQSINNWRNVGTIVSSSIANPSVITTSTAHNLNTGDTVSIAGHTGSTPSINGTNEIKVINSTTFTIPVNVTIGGTGGTVAVDPYSNIGYHVLGEIVDALAPGGYLGYVGQRVLSAKHWIPSTEWALGRAFYINKNPREPFYKPQIDGLTADNIFDKDKDEIGHYEQVLTPYGGFSPELAMSSGGLIMSAQAMLAFAQLYHCGYRAPASNPAANDHMGARIIPSMLPLIPGDPLIDNLHTGGFAGTDALIQQHPHTAGPQADIVIYIAFAKDKAPETPPAPVTPAWNTAAHDEIMAIINALPADDWPTATCDGFWVKLDGTEPTEGYGGYQSEYETFQGALDHVTDGSKLRIKQGSSSWTGTLNKRLILDAPEGTVTLGAN